MLGASRAGSSAGNEGGAATTGTGTTTGTASTVTGARIVSGYLHAAVPGVVGGQATHAWAAVLVPGAGWITFDPTNRSVGSANLIPVAVPRDILQVVPVAGSFVGAFDGRAGRGPGD